MTSDAETPFGRLLRQRRLAAGLSQEELAELAGVSARGIRALERGERAIPRPHTLRLLADGLELDGAKREAFMVAANVNVAANPGPSSPSSHPPPTRAQYNPVLRLPIPPTPLVGREQEAALVRAQLGRTDVRLVTLTGPGGVGKTRLALAVAADIGLEFSDGAVFVDLAALQSAELVPAAIARTLRVSGLRAQTPAEALADFLTGRSLLLVLDNCEHVLAALVLAAELLAVSTGLKVLATSRERLHLRGEREIPIAPLPTPAPIPTDRNDLQVTDSLFEAPAVRLFAERAAEYRPDFVVGDHNLAVVAEICRRLDGLPLALELAAARLRYLKPAELLHRLEQRLPVLTDGPRDLPVRQQTMSDTIAWSYQMLSEGGQELFRRISVFAGGGSFVAAFIIAQEPDAELPEELAVLPEDVDDQRVAALATDLEMLADKSLIRLLPDQDRGTRFQTLETIREFGMDALLAAGEYKETRARHAAYFRMLVERANEMLNTADGERWMTLLDAEYNNIHAALAWEAEQPNPDLLLSFVQPLGHYWYIRSFFSEARYWLGRALERGRGAAPGLRGDALYAAAMMARAQSDFVSAMQFGEEALHLARELGDSQRMLQALYVLGGAAQFIGKHELAIDRLEEGLALARQRGEPGRIAAFLELLGDVARAQGDDDRALQLAGESLAIQREMGDVEGVSWCLNRLGGLALDRGNLILARKHFGEALQLFQQLSNRAGVASAQCNVAATALRMEDGASARPLLCESLATFADLDDPGGIACVMEEFARLFLLQGQPERAASLLSAVAALREEIGEVLLPLAQANLHRTENAVRRELDAHSFAAAWSHGAGTPVQRIITDILASN